MRVNSIPSFTDRQGHVERFVSLDDDSIKQLAYIQTTHNIDDKKYKRQSRLFDLALPIAGGISAAAFAPKSQRLAKFGMGAGTWAFFLMGMGAVFGLEKFALKNSDGLADFSERHPVITFVASALTAFAAGQAAVKYGFKGVEKLVSTNAYGKFADVVKTSLAKVKSMPSVDKVVKFVGEKVAKTPSALKEAGKVAADWSPWAVILASFMHSSHNAKKADREFMNNYIALKDLQLAKAKEISMHSEEV